MKNLSIILRSTLLLLAISCNNDKQDLQLDKESKGIMLDSPRKSTGPDTFLVKPGGTYTRKVYLTSKKFFEIAKANGIEEYLEADLFIEKNHTLVDVDVKMISDTCYFTLKPSIHNNEFIKPVPIIWSCNFNINYLNSNVGIDTVFAVRDVVLMKR